MDPQTDPKTGLELRILPFSMIRLLSFGGPKNSLFKKDGSVECSKIQRNNFGAWSTVGPGHLSRCQDQASLQFQLICFLKQVVNSKKQKMASHLSIHFETAVMSGRANSKSAMNSSLAQLYTKKDNHLGIGPSQFVPKFDFSDWKQSESIKLLRFGPLPFHMPDSHVQGCTTAECRTFTSVSKH